MTKKCEKCNNMFEQSANNQKCCNDCRFIKCEYCGKETKNKKYCSLSCSGHFSGKIGGKIGGHIAQKTLREKKLSSFYNPEQHLIACKRAVEINKLNKTSFCYDKKLQSKGGKTRAKQMKETGTGLYDLKIQRMGGHCAQKTLKEKKLGLYGISKNDRIKNALNSQHILRINHRNLKYKNQYYDSNPEREIAICLMCQYSYKPKEGKNLHIRMKGGEIDYLLKNLKLFIEFHQYFRDETYEEYCNRRRKILDDSSYKDYKLVVIR